VPIGTGEAARIARRMPSMSPPVERSITVSAPYLRHTRACSSSPSTSLTTALLPMFAFTLQSEAMPMHIGSRFGWLTLAGMTMRPARDLAAHELGREALAPGDELHLLGDDALPRAKCI
jgi:hypothetical protein